MRQVATEMSPADRSEDAFAPMPLRSEAKVLRMWFQAWEDADRDLYAQGYVFVRVDDGRWLIEHTAPLIGDGYAPIRPPRTTGAQAPPATGAKRVERPSDPGQASDIAQALRALQPRRQTEPPDEDR